MFSTMSSIRTRRGVLIVGRGGDEGLRLDGGWVRKRYLLDAWSVSVLPTLLIIRIPSWEVARVCTAANIPTIQHPGGRLVGRETTIAKGASIYIFPAGSRSRGHQEHTTAMAPSTLPRYISVWPGTQVLRVPLKVPRSTGESAFMHLRD